MDVKNEPIQGTPCLWSELGIDRDSLQVVTKKTATRSYLVAVMKNNPQVTVAYFSRTLSDELSVLETNKISLKDYALCVCLKGTPDAFFRIEKPRGVVDKVWEIEDLDDLGF